MNEFTYEDLEKILKIKDRLIDTLLVGGGGALYDNEARILDELLYKARLNLKKK